MVLVVVVRVVVLVLLDEPTDGLLLRSEVEVVVVLALVPVVLLVGVLLRV